MSTLNPNPTSGAKPGNSDNPCDKYSYLDRKPAWFRESCDALLVVEDEAFPVHTSVLACHCKTFAGLFEVAGGGKERATALPQIKLDCAGISPQALTASSFATFLDHVYNPTEAKVESVSFHDMHHACHSRA